jgi:hypothetical protein
MEFVMASQYTLLVGFSYSLEPDGSPGSYNNEIASKMLDWVSGYSGAQDHLLLAAQWEIVDALSTVYNGPLPFAAPPPSFEGDDILDANGFIRLIKKGETDGTRNLRDELSELLMQVGYEYTQGDNTTIFDYASLNSERLAIYLNRLLDRNTFYQQFQTNVELHDMIRPDLGPVGLEERKIPAGQENLLPFQTRRINRLIIEALIPDRNILKRGTYLSTHGVLERVLTHFKDKVSQIKKVYVFGFPAHSPRCRRQTIEALWKARRYIDPENVINACFTDREDWSELPWDKNTAQIWCRSLQNWLDYEAMGLRRL